MKGDTRTCARFPSSLARPPLPSVRQSSPSGARSGSFFVPDISPGELFDKVERAYMLAQWGRTVYLTDDQFDEAARIARKVVRAFSLEGAPCL